MGRQQTKGGGRAVHRGKRRVKFRREASLSPLCAGVSEIGNVLRRWAHEDRPHTTFRRVSEQRNGQW